MSRSQVQQQRRWALRRRLGLSFATVAALLVVFSAIAVLAAIRFVRSGDDVIDRWQPAVAASERVLGDLVNQETAIRGYALSRESRFLQPYQNYVAAEHQDLAELRGFTRGDAALARSLHGVERAATSWQQSIATPLIAKVRSGQGPATGLLDVAGKRRFDRVRAAGAGLTADLTHRSTAARSDRRADGRYAAAFAALALLTVAAAGLTLWRGLHRWVLAPLLRLGAQTREVSSGGKQREIVGDGPAEITELGRDVEQLRLQIASELARAEEILDELQVRSEELARSNDDLQQFAYVASHDLSEPLRKVANFCQLLERQYGPQLDDRAKQYIDFAVDGAKRMQALITDLLALSRVGRSAEQFVAIDLDAKLDQAIANLGDRVPEDARIERSTPLPTVLGDRALLTSLLENLVGNAVKYRRPDVPAVVQLSAELDVEDGMWTVTVRDNGIGIDAAYDEKIFVVFQRLHLRDPYGGTGIGLALCRKIVQFHGGQIWLLPSVESAPGAALRFTVPECENRAPA